MANDFSRHHIVPSSVGGSNAKSNIVRLTHKYHVAFHQVFNNLAPHHQIERLLDISQTSLTEGFKKEILEIIQQDTDYIYERWILVKR